MVRTTPDDANDVKVLSDVEQHGWHLVAIDGDSEGPADVFSVGIYHTLAMPEICILGLSDTRVMGRIINDIGDLMNSGTEFKDWHTSSDILDGYSCIFRDVDRSFTPSISAMLAGLTRAMNFRCSSVFGLTSCQCAG